MIQANITTFIGQDGDAEHYYCHIYRTDSEIPTKDYQGGSWGTEEIDTELTEIEALHLNKKVRAMGYSCFRYKLGDKTTRFESINRIHQELIKRFPDEDIISYAEGVLFKEMLCRIGGSNVGYKYFEGTFNHVPRSCYKDLVPDTYKIRCHFCKKKFETDDVAFESDWDGRTILQFMKKRDVIEACNCFELEWDVIL